MAKLSFKKQSLAEKDQITKNLNNWVEHNVPTVERIIQVEVPIEKIVHKIVEIEKVVEKQVDRIVHVPIDKIVEIEKEVKVYVDREVEKIKEVPVEVIKWIEKPIQTVFHKVEVVPGKIWCVIIAQAALIGLLLHHVLK